MKLKIFFLVVSFFFCLIKPIKALEQNLPDNLIKTVTNDNMKNIIESISKYAKNGGNLYALMKSSTLTLLGIAIFLKNIDLIKYLIFEHKFDLRKAVFEKDTWFSSLTMLLKLWSKEWGKKNKKKNHEILEMLINSGAKINAEEVAQIPNLCNEANDIIKRLKNLEDAINKNLLERFPVDIKDIIMSY